MPPTVLLASMMRGREKSLLDYFPSYFNDPMFITGFITGFSSAAILFKALHKFT